MGTLVPATGEDVRVTAIAALVLVNGAVPRVLDLQANFGGQPSNLSVSGDATLTRLGVYESNFDVTGTVNATRVVAIGKSNIEFLSSNSKFAKTRLARKLW